MNVSGFPLMSTAARTDVSASSCWKSAMNSFLTEREMMLTDSPGESKVTIAIPSSTTIERGRHRMSEVGCRRSDKLRMKIRAAEFAGPAIRELTASNRS
jgi:hypothetical protein